MTDEYTPDDIAAQVDGDSLRAATVGVAARRNGIAPDDPRMADLVSFAATADNNIEVYKEAARLAAQPRYGTLPSTTGGPMTEQQQTASYADELAAVKRITQPDLRMAAYADLKRRRPGETAVRGGQVFSSWERNQAPVDHDNNARPAE